MKKIALFIILISFLSSCENDIEINAPWIETPVVYGLLDPNSSDQYIRIEKTYQNSATQTTQQGAQYPDSLYFDTLLVRVTSSFGNTYTFYKTPVYKKPGTFNNAEAYVYKCTGFTPDPSQSYKLGIYSPKTGKLYESQTRIVGKAKLAEVNKDYKLRIQPILESNRFIFSFSKGENAISYDVFIRLRYMEYPVSDPTAISFKQLDYPLGQNRSGADINSNPNKLYVATRDVLNFFKQGLPADPSVERKFIAFDYVAVGGSMELKVMIDLNAPTKSFVQNKPEFSNITNGLGIFSSRSIEVLQNLPFNTNFEDSSKYYIRSYLPRFVP